VPAEDPTFESSVGRPRAKKSKAALPKPENAIITPEWTAAMQERLRLEHEERLKKLGPLPF